MLLTLIANLRYAAAPGVAEEIPEPERAQFNPLLASVGLMMTRCVPFLVVFLA